MPEKKTQKKTAIKWKHTAAESQVMAIIAARKDWEAKGKVREMEQILTILSDLYPQDANNILTVLKGEFVAKKTTTKTKMKIVEEVIPHAATGCADCGEELKLAQKSFTQLETVEEVKAYFNASASKDLALHKMKEMLKSNNKPVPKSNDLTEVAKKVIALIESGEFMY